MYKQFLILPLVVLTTLLQAQLSFSDSLKNIFFTSKVDSAKLKAIQTLNLHYLSNNPDSALKYNQLYIEMAEQKGQKRMMANAYAWRGDILANLGQHHEQVRYLSRCMQLMEASRDTFGIATISMRMIGAYTALNNLKLAHQYNERTKALSDRLLQSGLTGLTFQKFIHRYNLYRGQLALKEKQFQLALLYLKKAEEAIIPLKMDTWFNCLVKESIARTYSGLNDTAKAIYYFRNALAENKYSNNKKGIANCNEGIARLMLTTNPTKDSILTHLTNAEATALRTKNTRTLLNVFEDYIRYYDRKGLFREKSNYQTKYQQLADSLHELTFSVHLAKIIAQSGYEEKERENAFLKEKTELLNASIKSTRRLYTVTIILLIVLFISTGLWLRHKRLQAQINAIELEYKLLRSQMDPHFIFNALTSVQAYVLSEEPLKAVTYISLFARLMRQNLENTRQELVTLKTEIETLKLYLELEQLRAGDNGFTYHLTIEENLPDTWLIPPMLIQPFVENAIKHGFKNLPDEEKGFLKITLNLLNKALHCTVEDNGSGLKHNPLVHPPSTSPHQSAGSVITQERLKMACKKTGFTYFFTMYDKKGVNNRGTVVTFLMPYVKT